MHFTDAEIHVSYQKDYFEKNQKKTMQPRGSAYIDRHVERMIKAGQLEHTDRIIDVGCGIGKYTLNLAQRGYQIEGLDIAPGLLAQLQRYNQKVPVHCADVVSPPIELWGQFDAVIGFFALHHMFNLDQSFLGAAKLLKKGGRLVFIEPNPYNVLYYMQILLTPGMTWKGDKGILQMRSSIIFPSMKRASLLNERLERYGFFPPFIADFRGAISAEKWLEKVPIWKKYLPFQIFMARCASC